LKKNAHFRSLPGQRSGAECSSRAAGPSQRTEADEAERLPPDAGGTGGHLPDLLHALHPRAFPQRLVEPRVPPVEVEDVADGGVGRLLHGGRGDVADGDPCGGNTTKHNRGSARPPALLPSRGAPGLEEFHPPSKHLKTCWQKTLLCHGKTVPPLNYLGTNNLVQLGMAGPASPSTKMHQESTQTPPDAKTWGDCHHHGTGTRSQHPPVLPPGSA